MTEGVGACMPIALRSVGEAIRLDSENKTKVWISLILTTLISSRYRGLALANLDFHLASDDDFNNNLYYFLKLLMFR